MVAVVAFAWVCFAVLAPWQLNKSDDLDARNARLAESVEAEPVPMQQVVDGPGAFVEREWRVVTLEGRWLPQNEALLRLRSIEGKPVFHVLTVFDPVEGQDILVNRGHVPVGENNAVPDYAPAPSGPVEITARVRKAEAGPTEPVVLDGLPAVRVVDPAPLGDVLGQPVVPEGYLQLVADQPGSLSPAPIPAIEVGPYLSYGLQWLAFGVLVPAALIYFAWSEIRARRNEVDEDSAAPAPADDDDARDPRAGGSGSGVPGSVAGESGSSGSRTGGGDDPAAENSTADVRDRDEADARERAMQARYGTRDDSEKRRAYRRADRLRS